MANRNGDRMEKSSISNRFQTGLFLWVKFGKFGDKFGDSLETLNPLCSHAPSLFVGPPPIQPQPYGASHSAA